MLNNLAAFLSEDQVLTKKFDHGEQVAPGPLRVNITDYDPDRTSEEDDTENFDLKVFGIIAFIIMAYLGI